MYEIITFTSQGCWSDHLHHVSPGTVLYNHCNPPCVHACRFHGKYPFVEETEAATIAKVIRGSYVLPNDGTCSQNVRSFIRAALTTDPR